MIETATNPAGTAFVRLEALVGAGGPVVAILLMLSVVALTLIILKLWQFAAIGIRRKAFIQHALSDWRAGRPEEALSRLENERNPIAGVMALAMAGRLEQKISEPLLREEVTRVATGHLEALRGQLKGLEVIGALSPLLGLLGTVLGMIEAFRQLELAGSQVDPAVLSGGIWEALLTTAVGLAVAIPVVAVLSALERALEQFRHRLEDAVTQVFTIAVPVVGQHSIPTLSSRRAADAH